MSLLPDMHRAGKLAEWETIDEDLWTDVQRRADETNGLDTPGNRETLKGVIASVAGVMAVGFDQPAVGVGLLFYGRTRDLKDGKVAAQTGTRSPLGEAFDAGADNLLAAIATPVLFKKNLITKDEAVIAGGVLGVKTLTSAVAKIRGQELHPSRAGKIGAFFVWNRYGTAVFAKALEQVKAPRAAEKMERFSRLNGHIGFVLEVAAALDYVHETFRARKA
ncbi:MAG: hypothetical protein JWO41_694 [Candidatus Saccharibacteria bacterium]|nr:hypothetical protein [Candidatus Saccharibacteria bacterium]